MKTAFTALPRPVLCCILAEETVKDAVATIRNAEFDGAGSFAIHLEPLIETRPSIQDFRDIADATCCPTMFLCYRKKGLERLPLTDEDRIEVFRQAIAAGAAAVDITADLFDESPREYSLAPAVVDRQKRFIDEVHQNGAQVVLSSHMAEARTCEQVLEQMTEMEKRGADYVKIVTQADTQDEFLESVKTTLALHHELRVPFIHLCVGRYARPQRYLAPALGSALTFATYRYAAHFLTIQPKFSAMRAIMNHFCWNIDDVK